jgi:hypothetical protein
VRIFSRDRKKNSGKSAVDQYICSRFLEKILKKFRPFVIISGNTGMIFFRDLLVRLPVPRPLFPDDVPTGIPPGALLDSAVPASSSDPSQVTDPAGSADLSDRSIRPGRGEETVRFF